MGVDVLVEFPLTPETAATAPEDFIKGFLQEKLHTAYLRFILSTKYATMEK